MSQLILNDNTLGEFEHYYMNNMQPVSYTHLDWDDLYNEDVQMATVIYNYRINTWRKMKKLDELLDKKPKANDVAAMAELRIRNLQALSLIHISSANLSAL